MRKILNRWTPHRRFTLAICIGVATGLWLLFTPHTKAIAEQTCADIKKFIKQSPEETKQILEILLAIMAVGYWIWLIRYVRKH